VTHQSSLASSSRSRANLASIVPTASIASRVTLIAWCLQPPPSLPPLRYSHFLPVLPHRALGRSLRSSMPAVARSRSKEATAGVSAQVQHFNALKRQWGHGHGEARITTCGTWATVRSLLKAGAGFVPTSRKTRSCAPAAVLAPGKHSGSRLFISLSNVAPTKAPTAARAPTKYNRLYMPEWSNFVANSND
jgi:hypothetical protein